MSNLVNYIALDNGNVELFAGSELIVASNNADVLAAAIVNAGGFDDDSIAASSSCDFADEYGFDSQTAFEDLWENTLKIVKRINELKGDIAAALNKS